MSEDFGTLSGLNRAKDDILFDKATLATTEALSDAFELGYAQGGVEIVVEADNVGTAGTATVKLYEGDTLDSIATTGTTIASFTGGNGILARFTPPETAKFYGKIGVVSSDSNTDGTFSIYLHELAR